MRNARCTWNRLCAQHDSAPPTNRRVELVESDDALSPMLGVFDNSTNPPVSILDAIGTIPLDLRAELGMMRQFVESRRCAVALASALRLTVDHAAALWLYTCDSPIYKILNRLLRNRNRQELMAGFFPYLRLMLEACAGLTQPVQRTVYRGVCLDLVGSEPLLYAKGNRLTWWGFSSAMQDIAVLQNPMLLGSKGDRTLFQITTRRGIDITPFSVVRRRQRARACTGTHMQSIHRWRARMRCCCRRGSC
jgi:hypothetical protein